MAKRLPTFETSVKAIVRELEERAGLPHLITKKATKGEREPRGTRIRKYGLTPEEVYMQYAPEGTAPERLLFGWLKRHGYMFTFQRPILGGRLPGGAVVDFVIYDKQPPIILRIMSYWHTSLSAQWSDALQKDRLMELGYQVVDLWEYDINTVAKVAETMRSIMYGAPKIGE